MPLWKDVKGKWIWLRDSDRGKRIMACGINSVLGVRGVGQSFPFKKGEGRTAAKKSKSNTPNP